MLQSWHFRQSDVVSLHKLFFAISVNSPMGSASSVMKPRIARVHSAKLRPSASMDFTSLQGMKNMKCFIFSFLFFFALSFFWICFLVFSSNFPEKWPVIWGGSCWAESSFLQWSNEKWGRENGTFSSADQTGCPRTGPSFEACQRLAFCSAASNALLIIALQ